MKLAHIKAVLILSALTLLPATDARAQFAGGAMGFQVAQKAQSEKPTKLSTPQVPDDIENLFDHHIRLLANPFSTGESAEARRLRRARLLEMAATTGVPARLYDRLKNKKRNLMDQIRFDARETKGDPIVRDLLVVHGDAEAIESLQNDLFFPKDLASLERDLAVVASRFRKDTRVAQANPSYLTPHYVVPLLVSALSGPSNWIRFEDRLRLAKQIVLETMGGNSSEVLEAVINLMIHLPEGEDRALALARLCTNDYVKSTLPQKGCSAEVVRRLEERLKNLAARVESNSEEALSLRRDLSAPLEEGLELQYRLHEIRHAR